MFTLNEHIELRKKLANQEITQEQAKEIYWNEHKDGKRAWHTKDWKERRSEVIKEKCEICSSKETLTLQHLSHPKKYSVYKQEVTKQYTKTFRQQNTTIEKDEFTNHIATNYNYIPMPLCPNCKSRNPNKRVRKTPQYLCTVCRHEFNEPVYKSLEELITSFYKNEKVIEVRDKCFVSKDKWKNQHNLAQIKYWLQRERAKANDSEAIGREAFLLYLDDNIKYLSFENTITACKKCAYYYDIKCLELCPNCKEYYKGIQYPTCIQCLPEDKRKSALEKIEIRKEWQSMHKKLGID